MAEKHFFTHATRLSALKQCAHFAMLEQHGACASKVDNSSRKMGIKNSQWFCAQIGAREHYAIPRVLHERGQLAALYTDFWAGFITRKLAQATNSSIGRSLAARYHSGLAEAPVVAWNLRSFFEEIGTRQKHALDASLHYRFIKIGQHFASRVRDHLKRRNDLDSQSIYFGYDTGALETLEWCRSQNLRCIVNQMDPNRIEYDLVREEEQSWPAWKTQALPVPEAYFLRREREWSLADRVVVNSEFSRAALVKQGVLPEKLVVVPLCYDAESGIAPKIKGWKAGEPLRVLFLGQVILRKGVQYLMQAARELEKENIRFDIVGSIGISDAAVNSAPANFIFHGRATRDQAAAWYQQSDLFVLPTLSDGFALTQLEAMAHGLPVVTTPCCGEVVTDGVDGFVIPPRDATALVQTFHRYLSEPELLKAHQSAALSKSRQFTRTRLVENLMRLEVGLNK